MRQNNEIGWKDINNFVMGWVGGGRQQLLGGNSLVGKYRFLLKKLMQRNLKGKGPKGGLESKRGGIDLREMRIKSVKPASKGQVFAKNGGRGGIGLVKKRLKS